MHTGQYAGGIPSDHGQRQALVEPLSLPGVAWHSNEFLCRQAQERGSGLSMHTGVFDPTFEWLKLNHMTKWASQCIAAISDYLEVFEVSSVMVLWNKGTAEVNLNYDARFFLAVAIGPPVDLHIWNLIRSPPTAWQYHMMRVQKAWLKRLNLNHNPHPKRNL